jgi:hypothetical protein
VTLGRLHLHGPQVWPDHVLSYELGNLIVGAVVQVRSWALGFELQGWHGYSNPWQNLYLGPFAFEIYFDADRSFDREWDG